MTDLAALSIEDFAPHIGGVFEAATDGFSVPLTLEAAEPLGVARREGGAFRLLFRGPAEPLLPQAIYSLSSGGEAYDIFIVPIARDGRGTEYEAIFT